MSLLKKLALQVLCDVALTARTGYDDTGGGRDEQSGNLCDQTVADREQRVMGRCIRRGHTRLEDADDEPTYYVDPGYDEAGNRVASDELASTVHRPVKVRLSAHLFTASPGLFFVDQSGVQVGVDGHLFTGHGIEREPCCNLRDTARPLRDHDKVDQHQHDEHDGADHVVARNDELAEGSDQLARFAPAEDQPGGRHVQRQPEKRGDEQHPREDGEVERPQRVKRRQEHGKADRDVRCEEDVEQERGYGDDHDEQNRNDSARDHHLGVHPFYLGRLYGHGVSTHVPYLPFFLLVGCLNDVHAFGKSQREWLRRPDKGLPESPVLPVRYRTAPGRGGGPPRSGCRIHVRAP